MRGFFLAAAVAVVVVVIFNGASSPVAVGNNPSTQYTSGSFNVNTSSRAHQYGLRVDFFDVTGHNISSSGCTLVGQVDGNR